MDTIKKYHLKLEKIMDDGYGRFIKSNEWQKGGIFLRVDRKLYGRKKKYIKFFGEKLFVSEVK